MRSAFGVANVRLGQTSAVHFASQLGASAAGFVATLYIAREFGGAVLGTYALFVAVLAWLQTGIGAGVDQAVTKRVSELSGGGRDVGAAVLIEMIGFGVIALLILAARPAVDAFLGFNGAGLLVLALAAVLAFSLIRSTLHGQHRVHIAALLRPLDRIVRSAIQIAVVLLGVLGGGLVGLVWGYVAGAAVAALVGVVLLSLRPRWPTRENVLSILDFTRYAWLSGVEQRAFSAMDTVILGVFVSSTLIGYYEIAWNLASILAIFGTSISQTLFPTISELDSDAAEESIGELITTGLAYSGLFLVPGLVGVLVVGEHVLAIYGGEFQRAWIVLTVLVTARLVYAYEATMIMSLNAIDRPAVAFRVNLAFVAANVGLNLVLVAAFGWVGAAVGTALSAAIGLVLAYVALNELVSFAVPVGELARQGAAAAAMGAVIWTVTGAVERTIPGAIPEAVTLVTVGAVVYFVTLLSISTTFRTTVQDNIQG